MPDRHLKPSRAMEEPSIPDITDTIAKRLPLRNKNDDSVQHNDVPKTAMKTASKAQRVALENGEGAAAKASTPSCRVLRNGKRILQTPAKAIRVLVETPAMTNKKALRVPVDQDAEMDVNVNKNTAVSGESAASEQTAGDCEAADSIEDSSWLDSTNMVPIMPSETQTSPADDTVDEDLPKEEPANMDACLAVMQKAGLVTEGYSSYSCDTHAVAASHGLVNVYTPLPAKTPQNTPDVREKRTLAPNLQLTPTDQQDNEVPSPPSSSHLHPSSHALEDSFSLGTSPAPSAPPLKPQQTGTSKVLWKHEEDASEAPASSTERDAGVPCEQPDMQLQLDPGSPALASAESKVKTTPQATATEQHDPASLEESATKQGQPVTTKSSCEVDQFATPEPQPMAEEVLCSSATPVDIQAPTQVIVHADETSSTSSTAAYIPREKTTPFLARKLRDIKAKEWSANDEVKVHKSKLEREKEAAAAARKNSMSSVDKTITRKLVQNAVGKAVRTAGKNLGESLVKHKSRLEKEKEAAAAQARAAPGSKAVAPKKAITTSAFEGQGLDAMKVHKSRLEREREEVAMRRAAGRGAGEEKPLPSYMRATKASIAMKVGGLGEDMKVHKSQLERDQEAAHAAHAARKKAGVNPLTPFPHKARRSETASAAVHAAFGGHGLGDMPKHMSALEKAKEASKTGAGLPKRAPARPPINRNANVAAGSGLGDMKVHKTRLEKDKEAWDKAAAAHVAAGKPGAKSGTSGEASPSYLRSTMISQIRAGAPTPKKEEQGFSNFVPN